MVVVCASMIAAGPSTPSPGESDERSMMAASA
jgi:hypothetical protein